jgi:hypothetical protein
MASEWDSFWEGLRERLLIIAAQIAIYVLIGIFVYVAVSLQ